MPILQNLNDTANAQQESLDGAIYVPNQPFTVVVMSWEYIQNNFKKQFSKKMKALSYDPGSNIFIKIDPQIYPENK